MASFIASKPAVRSAARILLYPLIGILYVSDRIFTTLSFNGELAVTAAGVFAAIGIGSVYVGPIVAAFCKISKLGKRAIGRRSLQVSFASCVTAVLVLVLGETLGISMLLMVGAISVLLSFILLGALSALSLGRLIENWKKHL